jgi:outer membrane protein assembly factor BamE
MMQKFLITVFCSASLLLSGCAIYKVDVRQGNLVTQEMLDQLALNMPTKKVRFIMGTPLLVDVFHQQRWDYLYSFQPGAGEAARKQRKISLFFDENERLTQVKGDVKIGKQQLPKPVQLPEGFDQEPIL